MRRMLDLSTLRARVAAGETFEFLHFWGHTPRPDGQLGKECFSQWYACAFVLDDVRYATAEHYMMAGKARLFGDDEVLAQIVASTHPAEAKQLGRKVRNFDDKTWKAACFAIVVEGNVGKFGQNPALAKVLLDTGERVLVEASPRDRIWGIGMGASNPDADNPLAWRGQNKLGFALMEARRRLRAG
jgi:hypothetical protein